MIETYVGDTGRLMVVCGNCVGETLQDEMIDEKAFSLIFPMPTILLNRPAKYFNEQSSQIPTVRFKIFGIQ